jgi:hypothetical protein
MISLNPKPVVLALCLAAGLAVGGAHAQSTAGSPPGMTAPTGPISLLGGKMAFTVPSGFVGGDLPTGATGVTGHMFMNQEAQRAVVTTEAPTPTEASDNDSVFLAGAVQGFVTQQKLQMPDYKQTGEKSFTIKTLGVREIDSTGSMGANAVRNTTFVAASGKRLAVVQVISNLKDESGHDAAVKQVLASMGGK